MNIPAAIARLNNQLPLSARQHSLPEELQSLHRAVLLSFIEQGKPLSLEQMRERFPGLVPEQAVKKLAQHDLVVLDMNQRTIVGSYPMTLEVTPHRVGVNGHIFYAMCALDAMAIGPMFNLNVVIDSRCAMTGEAVHIEMQGHQPHQVRPRSGIQVGIRWQPVCGTAAHSMCREMVFLRDIDVARQWHAQSQTDCSLFTLAQAVDFGGGFFSALL